MKKVTGEAALEAVFSGKMLEFGDRYYRFNKKTRKMEYRDYNVGKWKESSMKDANEVTGSVWNLVEQ